MISKGLDSTTRQIIVGFTKTRSLTVFLVVGLLKTSRLFEFKASQVPPVHSRYPNL
jgi:hypothetical protein